MPANRNAHVPGSGTAIAGTLSLPPSIRPRKRATKNCGPWPTPGPVDSVGLANKNAHEQKAITVRGRATLPLGRSQLKPYRVAATGRNPYHRVGPLSSPTTPLTLPPDRRRMKRRRMRRWQRTQPLSAAAPIRWRRVSWLRSHCSSNVCNRPQSGPLTTVPIAVVQLGREIVFKPTRVNQTIAAASF